MAQAEEIGNGETQNISMKMSNFPRDLLHRYISGNHFPHKYQQPSEDTEEEIELSLGLSLNGRFGVDPRANRLTRSSSIPDFLNPTKDNDTARVIPMAYTPLSRTCSLPTETAEAWRKRKELQTLRRMEAKRKRSEKQRNLRVVRDRNRVFAEENCEEDKREEGINGNNQLENFVKNSTEILHFGVPSWVNGGKGACGIELKAEEGNGLGGVQMVLPPAGAASQVSIGSQRSGSSGISDFESQPVQGMNKCSEARSPASVQSVPESEHKPPVARGTPITEKSGNFTELAMDNQSEKPAVADKGVKEMMRNVLEDMPCVSTKGDGPNGKRIEGFLYRYRKGEEVRIVCVCHGSFLSPAEFVKHAGGGDVEHPLKHIVVNPSSLL